ncbi:hypothetical protein [Pedosphaera parvula]|nr:hypothetical protein [Pedosphaera parvula]
MKKFVLLALGLFCAASVAVHAEDAKPKHHMTDEQKALMKEMVAKYDTNKDGKLDKEERAKMSQEDKDKLDKAGIGKHKKDKDGEEKKTDSAAK